MQETQKKKWTECSKEGFEVVSGPDAQQKRAEVIM